MIKLFEGDDEGKAPKKETSDPYSLNITPEADPEPLETPPGDAPVQTPASEETVMAEQPLEDPPLPKIQEEPAALRQEELPDSQQVIPPPHTYEPEEPPSPPPTGREFPPGFNEKGPEDPPVLVETPYQPPSKAEAIRSSGLAWSAGIIFFGSIVFMLILGWGADLLLGSSPWGIVGGIVLGSLIGFIQFFRISSQIFKK